MKYFLIINFFFFYQSDNNARLIYVHTDILMTKFSMEERLI